MNIKGNEEYLKVWALFINFIFLMMFVDARILPIMKVIV